MTIGSSSPSRPQPPAYRSNASPRIISYAKLLEQGFRLRRAPITLFSLDPSGEGDDRTGLMITERHEMEMGEPHDPDFQVEHAFMMRHAERLDRDMEFPDVMALLLAYHKAVLKKPKAVARHYFLIEINGVGFPYASMLRKMTGPGYVIPIITTNSADDDPYTDQGKPRMPRMAGLDLFRIMIQLQRFMIARGAKGAALLVDEMKTFIQSGKRPEAAAGNHDDLVLAGAHTVWAGARLIPPTARAKRFH